MRFYFRLSWFLFRSSRTGTFEFKSTTSCSRSRGARSLARANLRMDAATYAAVSGRGSVNCRARVRGSASRKRAGHIRGNIPLEISGITITTNLAGVDRATGDEVKSSTAMRVLAQCKKEPRLVNSKRGRKCGQGQNRTADTRIFQSSCCTRTKCHYRSLLVSIQAFNGAVRRSILPIRTGIGALSSNTVTQPTFP
jgi:hypothetical protein